METGIRSVSRENDEQVSPEEAQMLLRVDNLFVELPSREATVYAVNGLSYSLRRGQSLAILGESGSGKTMSVNAILGMLPRAARVPSGRILFDGRDILSLPPQERRRLRGREIAMITQDALSALNPVFTVGDQIGEMFRVHLGLSRREAAKRAIALMERLQIPAASRRLSAYPHEFSGGMRQRIVVAIAIALEPALLIADEPTTAIDVTSQAQLIELLKELQRELQMALIIVTHDLGVAAEIAEEALVMYAGRLAERGPLGDLYERPSHPYLRGLLDSTPRVDRDGGISLPIPGTPPDLTQRVIGCAFAPRCTRASEICLGRQPEPLEVEPGRRSACHYAAEILDAS